MDTITVAIIGALSKLSETIIADAYHALKAAIVQKCGLTSGVSKAIEEIEKKPDSTGRRETLNEEIVDAKIANDKKIARLANTLFKKLKELPGGDELINQTVTGNNNIFSGSGNVTVTNKTRKSR